MVVFKPGNLAISCYKLMLEAQTQFDILPIGKLLFFI